MRLSLRLLPLLGLAFSSLLPETFAKNATASAGEAASNHAAALILGGGLTGVIAARTLHEQGIDDFIIIEAEPALGGRFKAIPFGVPGREKVVEVGTTWIQGTQTGNGPVNPIWELALKHNLSLAYNDIWTSITTYDYNGYNNYTDTLMAAGANFVATTILAGQRLRDNEVDMSLASGYGILGVTSKTPQEEASDYYNVDYECKSSFIRFLSGANHFGACVQMASHPHRHHGSLRHGYNFSYVAGAGGYSMDNYVSIDQRGFVYMVEAEASEFLQPQQVFYNQTVNLIEYSDSGVTVTTKDGTTYTGDHVLCTFSIGVLQNTDVVFQPSLPSWKVEAINSITMTGYTKILLQFNESFWFSTQMGVYADKRRGRYPLWQSLDCVGFFPGSGIIIATVTGDWTAYVERLTDDEVQAEVMSVLRAMYPNITVPDPVAFSFYRWGTDPLYRGAFSTWGPTYVQTHSDNLRASLGDQVWFAGEATSATAYGFMQAAFNEGVRVGSALADCIHGNGTCTMAHTNVTQNAEPYSSSLMSV